MVDNTKLQNQVVKCKDGKYQLITEDIPELSPSQILIQIGYTTVNPVDRFFYTSVLNEGNPLGSEGSGTIVKAGSDVDQSFVGKKVAFWNGAYGKYKVEESNNILILVDSQDLPLAANAWINPYTAIGQLQLSQKKGATASIITAGASQLGQQWIKFANQNNIQVISVVRKDQHVKFLKEEFKQKYVLNQTSPNFASELEEAIKELNPTIFFDYIGGDVPAQIFSKMSNGSELVVVGNLSHSAVPVDTWDLLFTDKQVKSFLIYRWLPSLDSEYRKSIDEIIRNDLKEGGKIFGAKAVKTVALSEWETAMNDAAALATEGKFLIECNQ